MNMKEIAARLNNDDWEPLYIATEKQIHTLIAAGKIDEDFYCYYEDYQEEMRCETAAAFAEFRREEMRREMAAAVAEFS